MSNDKVQSIMALKPCPFCGNETPEFERMGTPRQSCIVICGHCGARHESSDEGEFNGTSWNDRAAIREAIAAPGVAQGPLKVEQIEGLEVWKQFVGLWPDKRLEIVRTIEAAHGIAAPSPTAEQPERPPNCGSGHCSCIECPYGSIKGGPAE